MSIDQTASAMQREARFGATTRIDRPVVLIGAAGLIGRHLLEALRPGPLIATCHVQPVEGAISLDITDAAALTELIDRTQPDAVIMAAAEPWVERCEREPEATGRLNVDPVRTAAAACARSGATLVVFSSEYVFDGSAGEYREDDTPRPLNEYGRQKVAVEAAARSTPRHLICRASGAYGWEPKRKNFVCQLVDALRSGKSFEVPADQLITPTYAPEIATAIRSLLDRDARGTFNVVGPTIVARPEFARDVARIFKLPADRIIARPTTELRLVAPRPRRAGLSDARLAQTIGHHMPRYEVSLAEMAQREPR